MGEFGLGAGAADGAPAATETGISSAVKDIWVTILGLDDPGLADDFFELGGDSLAAVRMLAQVEDELLAQVSFTDFLEAPTIAALAEHVARCGEQPAVEDQAGAAAAGDQAPCSFAQERLWFLEQLDGASAAYNMPIGTRLRGALDQRALQQALDDVVARHRALRTRFTAEGGHPVQVIDDAIRVALEHIDLRGHADPEAEAQRLVDDAASRPFALDAPPLMRALLLRTADDEHVLELVFHHIICDGWSHVVILRELGQLYDAHTRGQAPELPAPRVQFPEHARAERDRLDDQALAEAVAPWLERLAGAPGVLDLPTDHARPAVPSYRGATHRTPLADATAARVREFAREARATPFATLLSAYYVLLARHSGQDDIVVGVTTSGRGSPGLEDGVGLWANTVALRGELGGEPSFRELVQHVREVVMWAVAHEQAPFERIVAQLPLDRDLSRHPLFQVFCAHVPLVSCGLPGARPYDARPSTSRFDLTLFVEEEPGDALELAWEYSADLFEPETIDRLARRYVRLLEEGLADPDRSIAELSLLDETERAAVLARGAERVRDRPVACMHERFERCAAAAPEAIALSFESQTLTYGELNARANRLAHHLRALGAGPETLVALFLEPSLDLVVAILATLKAGAAYLPLDPEHPAERLEFVLGDAAPVLLVAAERLLERLPAHRAQTVCLGRDDAAVAQHPSDNPTALATPENLAYVIYTSGSTGQPKGVQVEHRQVARLFSATEPWFGFGSDDTWVMLHSYAFDFSVWELWGALAHGGRLVLSPVWTTRSPAALAGLVADERVTVLNATPSLFITVQDDLLARAQELALRFVVFGGEALKPPSLKPWFARFGDAGPTLVNMYGITETTVHVTYRPLRAADCDREVSPIGVPIPDLSLYLLDPKGTPVPDGVAGELYVGGAGVARGYLRRPELNAARFVDNPFGPGRLYRAGDVARRLPGGELDFRGRIDDQVKIRGFRIELGEIEAAIREVDGVGECAVLAVEAAPGDLRLAAYVVAAREDVTAAIWEHLGDKLPAYMVPASLSVIERIPLTRNGKLDRRALPAPTWEKERAQDSSEPQTPNEQMIAEIWQSVLSVQSVGRQDNFFNLGGHSLLAARVVTKVRQKTGAQISVRSLFSQPTLEGFAALLDGATAPAAPVAAAAPATPAATAPPPGSAATPSAGAHPLSFPQQQLVFFDQLSPGSVTYNAALATRVRGELDLDALRASLAVIFERHEALRTVLVWEGDVPSQVALEQWTLEVPVVDLSGVPAHEREDVLAARLRDAALVPFDLSRELMLRTTVFSLGQTEHVVLFAPHHIAFDAWAVEVLYRELAELYDARRSDRAPRLPELALQYRDFARSQREHLQGPVLDGKLDFWRSHLAGAPTVAQLPVDRPRPPALTFDGATERVVLHCELADGIRDLCATHQVTPYMLLLAAFATLLYRRSGQDDILLGGPMANRELPGLEHLIGFFANTIVVRARLAGNPEFAELLARVRDSVLASLDHQDVPLELVVEAARPVREPGVNPLFQVNFRVRVGEPARLTLTGTETEPVTVDLGLARFDLALELHLLADRVEAEFNYNTALFDRSTVIRLADDFQRLLEQVIARPQTRLLSLQLGADEPAAPGVAAARSVRSIQRRR